MKGVFFEDGVEEQEPNAANVNLPNFGIDRTGTGLHGNGQFVPLHIDGVFQRQKLNSGIEIGFLLPTFDVKVLFEIALIVKEPDGNERDSESAGALDMVAGKNTETAGVNRHRLMNPKLQRKVGDGLRTKNTNIPLSPGGLRFHILGHSAICLIDSGIENEFGGSDFQPFGRELLKKGDGIVPELTPSDRVEGAEQPNDFGMPTPPKVVGESDAFIVESLRGDAGDFA